MNEDMVYGCFLVMLILGFGVLIFLMPAIHYSSTRGGEHSGYVTAMESKGIIWQNWRVYFKTDNSSSQEDVYCVSRNDLDLVEDLKDANKSRQQVVIRYEGMRSFEYGACDGEYIKSVEVVNE